MQPAETDPSDGYAVVDAMVALVILTMTVALALSAGQVARRAAAAAEETNRATLLLRYLVDTAPQAASLQSGRANGFTWRVAVRPSPSSLPPIWLCQRSAELVSNASHRRYRLETAAICPPPPQTT